MGKRSTRKAEKIDQRPIIGMSLQIIFSAVQWEMVTTCTTALLLYLS